MERTTNPSDELPVYAQIAAVIAATNSPSSTVGSAGAATGAAAGAAAKQRLNGFSAGVKCGILLSDALPVQYDGQKNAQWRKTR